MYFAGLLFSGTLNVINSVDFAATVTGVPAFNSCVPDIVTDTDASIFTLSFVKLTSSATNWTTIVVPFSIVSSIDVTISSSFPDSSPAFSEAARAFAVANTLSSFCKGALLPNS